MIREHIIKGAQRKIKRHAEIVKRKEDKITGLTALLVTHEQADCPDYDEIREVKKRLHVAQQQKRAMGI